MMDNLLITLKKYLEDDVGNDLALLAKSYGVEDRFLYTNAGFRFRNTDLGPNGELFAICFIYTPIN